MTGVPDEEIQYCTLIGNRIVENHMALYFDSLSCSLVLNNQNIDCEESCGVYRMLKKEEDFRLSPDDAFRIGSLEFQVQRFNVGVVSDIGQRSGMEDSFQIIQDLKIDEKI